ncbi:MAG: 7-carboxy-7-deazaguanine synthase QueE, partial [Methanophagales archaeon]|nr:7-carboxy-7-deazaguanine synthase QueE [Methanophagales archaeon]
MKKGYITEIFSSFQGEGPLAGRRQLFIRFAGCPLSCFYCDTSYARNFRQKFCTVLFHGKKARIKRNPLSTDEVMDYVRELLTPDVHSICYTGGEPLSSAAFVKEIAAEAKMMQLKNFLETSGNSARAFASLADYFDFASIDIKLRTHRAVEEKDYDKLYSNELECIRIAVRRGIETVAKVIVIKNT